MVAVRGVQFQEYCMPISKMHNCSSLKPPGLAFQAGLDIPVEPVSSQTSKIPLMGEEVFWVVASFCACSSSSSMGSGMLAGCSPDKPASLDTCEQYT